MCRGRPFESLRAGSVGLPFLSKRQGNNMHIGACRIQLHIPGSTSLKDKRAVVKSVTSRVRNKYNVSITEIESHDLWQLAVLGITCVNVDPYHVQDVLNKIVSFIEESYLEAEISQCDIDMLEAL